MKAEEEIIRKIQEQVNSLCFEILRQKLDYQVLLMHPQGKAAKKILARYAKGFRTFNITFDLN